MLGILAPQKKRPPQWAVQKNKTRRVAGLI
jgi:hypothetical protein